MKKHILSRYSEKGNKEVGQLHTTEKTLETRTIENSDPDEFVLGPTVVTENVEASDPDEFTLQAPTISTFLKEDSDPDEFLVGAIANYYGGGAEEKTV